MESRIRAARERVGLSQKELALALHIKPTTFNGYETGAHDPKSEVLAGIARVCDTSVDFLLGLTSNPNPNKNPPAPAEPETGENELELFRRALYDLGFVREGQNLTSAQAEIVLSALRILKAALVEAQPDQERDQARGAR